MERTVAEREYLLSRGFREDEWGFYKDNFMLLKTTLDIKYEVWNDKKVWGFVSRTVEEIEQAYFECTGDKLKENDGFLGNEDADTKNQIKKEK